MLSDDLEGWDGRVRGRSERERIHVHIQLLHFAIQKKPTQHCKATLMLSIVVQSLSCVPLFAAPGTAAHQSSLALSVSWSWLTLMSIESVMPSKATD